MSAASRATKIDCPGELRPIRSRPLEMAARSKAYSNEGAQSPAAPDQNRRQHSKEFLRYRMTRDITRALDRGANLSVNCIL
jgi:hypothetical protein